MNVDAAKLRKWEQRNADPKVSGDKKKIEELKKNPIKRDDDDLIKSLKDKLK